MSPPGRPRTQTDAHSGPSDQSPDAPLRQYVDAAVPHYERLIADFTPEVPDQLADRFPRIGVDPGDDQARRERAARWHAIVLASEALLSARMGDARNLTMSR